MLLIDHSKSKWKLKRKTRLPLLNQRKINLKRVRSRKRSLRQQIRITRSYMTILKILINRSMYLNSKLIQMLLSQELKG